MISEYRHEAAPPTPKEAEAWAQELRSFNFPDFCAPPVDAWEYVLAEYKKVRGLHLRDKVRPEERYSLITVAHSFFAWLFDKSGSEWLLKLFGVEEVAPHHGYRYWYGGAPHSAGATLIGNETESMIRIFIKHSINRFQEPAYEQYGAIDEMKLILAKLYKHNDKSPMYASDGMWKWALTALRNWFTEPVDKFWPYDKPDRINGMQWAKNAKDPWCPTDSMWSSIIETEKYRPRAYRVEQRGGVIWCGKAHINSEPSDKFMYKEGIKAIQHGLVRFDEEGLIKRLRRDFRCESCDRVLPCVTKVKHIDSDEHLCDHCFGTQIESGTRDTLDNCTYSECYECPNYIRNTDDLKNLKYQMNQRHQWSRG